MADKEDILFRLFDSLWFERQIFSTNVSPVLEVHDQQENEEPFSLSRIQTLHVRSLSDQFLTSKNNFSLDSHSPNSVLHSPKLQTILSGKEVGEFSDPMENSKFLAKKREIDRKRRRKNSKSLSELEFEELKGFMDLGFVFSEEDKDSNLVSVVPGLQRLGRNVGHDGDKESAASRPYLSEAWDVWEQRKREERALMNLRIPNFGNEVDMKDQLRFWAHSVASAVK